MPWTELHIYTTAEHATNLSNQLALLGAQALTLQDAGDQPIYEPTPDTPRLWQKTIVTGLFDSNQPMDGIVEYLQKQQALGFLESFQLQSLEDEDWERRCLEGFKPLRFGKRLWICPSWQTPPDPKAINVILDPGLAFGTGTHATTALCLEWLDENIKPGMTVIDYGCGSGILAIAALKLGARKAYAIDNDPQALEATQQNGERNQLISPLLETHFPQDPLPQLADVLIANILAKPLIELAPKLFLLLHSKGKIILSGILMEQVQDVIEAYNPWFYMENFVVKEGWIRLEGVAES